jgi:hypothetical protein
MDKGIGAVKNEIDFVQLSQGVKTLCSEAVIWLLRMAILLMLDTPSCSCRVAIYGNRKHLTAEHCAMREKTGWRKRGMNGQRMEVAINGAPTKTC